jgi:hypothetical protein
MGQEAVNGAEYASNLPLERQKMSSSAISTGKVRVSGGCADLPWKFLSVELVLIIFPLLAEPLISLIA